jgi:hypothetical protein
MGHRRQWVHLEMLWLGGRQRWLLSRMLAQRMGQPAGYHWWLGSLQVAEQAVRRHLLQQVGPQAQLVLPLPLVLTLSALPLVLVLALVLVLVLALMQAQE